MKNPVFYSIKLSLWDKLTVVLYMVLTMILLFYFGHSSAKTQRSIVFAYGFGTQLFLYILNYKSLRNLKVYLFWIIVGCFHLYVHLMLKNNPLLRSINGHAATGLRNTLFLLVLFQFLRIISLKIQCKELVSPGNASTTDLFDERLITLLDFGLFAVYMTTAIILLNL